MQCHLHLISLSPDSYNQHLIISRSLSPLYSADGRVHLSNPHLADLESDTLYHLALGTSTHNLEAMFGDVKFVCMGGTVKRMHEFAKMVARELGLDGGEGDAPLVDLTAASNRYSMYKVGPVLSISVGNLTLIGENIFSSSFTPAWHGRFIFIDTNARNNQAGVLRQVHQRGLLPHWN